jgi:hypothetical protein
VQDYFMSEMDVPALTIVGMEGLFGCIALFGCILPIAQVTGSSEGPSSRRHGSAGLGTLEPC